MITTRLTLLLLVIGLLLGLSQATAQLPSEPVEIARGVPQFFVDDWLVDNRYAIKLKNQAVLHQVHPPQKHGSNPVYSGDSGYVNVARHPESGKFQLWTQVHQTQTDGRSMYAIAYAESDDGLIWDAPHLGLHSWNGSTENNIVIRGPREARASGQQLLLTLAEKDKPGFTYIMTYRTGGAGKENDGMRLVGSNDGIHWHTSSEQRLLHLHSDTLNSIVYDSDRDRYLMTCRAKDRYRRFGGDMIDTGASRRISVLTSDELWTEWQGHPQTLLTPDEVDAQNDFNLFYGMPVHHYAGVYWGFLWVFRLNDPIHTELVTSRDGVHWRRAPHRTPLIPMGEPGQWDDGMTFGGPHWIEVDDEWWFYYAGHDGGHDSKDRRAAVGLATCKKERLIGLHGPASGGGVVVTRLIKWPGGDLFVNTSPSNTGTADADSQPSVVSVRVSDAIRDPLEGFDHGQCDPVVGDDVRHRVTWKDGRSMQELAGQVVRLEIFLQNADLFTIVAQ